MLLPFSKTSLLNTVPAPVQCNDPSGTLRLQQQIKQSSFSLKSGFSYCYQEILFPTDSPYNLFPLRVGDSSAAAELLEKCQAQPGIDPAECHLLLLVLREFPTEIHRIMINLRDIIKKRGS